MAQRNSPVLISGERGSRPERELLARTIHNHSQRANATFTKLSWEFLSESFVEAQLFGSDRTGLTQNTLGLIGRSEGGTLYIEELTRFSMATQAKLATLISSGRYSPTNSPHEELADVRMIVGTCQPPNAFERDDNVFPALRRELLVHSLTIPPLHERPDEIPPIAQQLCLDYSERTGRQAPTFSRAAQDALTTYAWPENIEELTRTIKNATDACTDHVIEIHHLPQSMIDAVQSPPSPPANLRDTLDRIERTMIVEALQIANGNQTRAAKILGISERLMGLRVRKYDINPKTYRTKA